MSNFFFQTISNHVVFKKVVSKAGPKNAARLTQATRHATEAQTGAFTALEMFSDEVPTLYRETDAAK